MLMDEDGKTNLLTLIVEDFGKEKKGKRADRYLGSLESLPSRSQLKTWFESKAITRDGKALTPATKVFPGDQLILKIPPEREARLEARDIPLQIIYEDKDLLVIFKPRGLSMHPGAKNDDQDTVVHALLHHGLNTHRGLSNVSGKFRPGIIHRLDKDTEGLVVVAKNNEVHENLSRQFSERTVSRAYWALVWGKTSSRFEIDRPIGRHPVNRKKMAVIAKGKPARTEITRRGYYENQYSWVECKLHSGRTHQIRVHLSHAGHPVLNDPLYGRPKQMKLSQEKIETLDQLKGQALIAFRLGFQHPTQNKRMEFEVSPPDWLQVMTDCQAV